MPSLRVFFSNEKNVFFSCFTWPGPRLAAHYGAVRPYSEVRRVGVHAESAHQNAWATSHSVWSGKQLKRRFRVGTFAGMRLIANLHPID